MSGTESLFGALPQPYYEDEFATLYHGDAVEILALLARASADLLVTDPPYGVEFVSNRRGESFGEIVGDDAFPVATVTAAFRVATIVRQVEAA